jgi:hypothetical protein
MATYLCLSCKTLYIDPQRNGTQTFHVCGEQIDHASGARRPYPNPRDENVYQDKPGGVVRMKAAGAGRIKIDEDDALTAADPDQLEALRNRPAIGPSPLPDPAPPVPTNPVMPSGPQ